MGPIYSLHLRHLENFQIYSEFILEFDPENMRFTIGFDVAKPEDEEDITYGVINFELEYGSNEIITFDSYLD